MFSLNKIQRALADSSGFTLIEVLIAVSLTSIAVGLVGTGIFQVTDFRRFWADDVLATRDLRHADSWFSGDALNAEDALDGPGGSRLVSDCDDPPTSTTSTVTLTWTDTSGTPRWATYDTAAGTLTREDESNPKTEIIREGVVDNSVKFSLCTLGGKSLLTLEMEVEADRGESETVRLRTHLRKMTP